MKKKKSLYKELKTLEEELNSAHKEYLKYKDVKSEEYKKARNKYLDLAEKYRVSFENYVKKEGHYENEL